MSASEDQDYVRIAWLYYMEGATQADIAKKLGMTRLRVNRMLAEARESGLVRVQINARLQSCVELERQLEADFNLEAAIIIPTPEDQSLIPVNLGRAGGEFLSRYLQENEIHKFGVGWGETILHIIRHLPETRRPDMHVNSLMGGLTQGLEINTFEIARELARRLEAKCSYLVAPIYAGSPQSRDIILEQEVFALADKERANDLALLSIGELSPRSLLVRHGLPKDVSMQELEALGAVGDVMGQFFTREGALIPHGINERVIALSFEELRKVRTTIFAAGGRHKTEAIAGVLSAGLGSVLVCDEDTARAAAAMATRPPPRRS